MSWSWWAIWSDLLTRLVDTTLVNSQAEDKSRDSTMLALILTFLLTLQIFTSSIKYFFIDFFSFCNYMYVLYVSIICYNLSYIRLTSFFYWGLLINLYIFLSNCLSIVSHSFSFRSNGYLYVAVFLGRKPRLVKFLFVLLIASQIMFWEEHCKWIIWC